MLQAAEQISGLAWVKPALSKGKGCNAQNVPIIEIVHIRCISLALQAALLLAGHTRDALVLTIMGQYHQAWEMPGLSLAQRVARMQVPRVLVRHMLQHCLGNLYCCEHMAGRNIKVLEVHAQWLLCLIGNVEVHTFVLASSPALGCFLQRSVSTDDIEALFGVLVMLCGFKPELQMVVGCLGSMAVLAWIRRNAHSLQILAPASSESPYSHHGAVGEAQKAWQVQGEAATVLHRAWEAKVYKQAMGYLGQLALPPVRKFFKV